MSSLFSRPPDRQQCQPEARKCGRARQCKALRISHATHEDVDLPLCDNAFQAAVDHMFDAQGLTPDDMWQACAEELLVYACFFNNSAIAFVLWTVKAYAGTMGSW